MKTAFQVLDQWLTQFVLAWADEIRRGPKPPAPFTFSLEDLNVGNRFKVTVTLPPLAEGEAGEVVSRRLDRSIGGGAVTSETLAADVLTFEHEALQGDVIDYSLTNIDDADNISEPRTAQLTVTDTTPPAIPGELSFAVVEQPD